MISNLRDYMKLIIALSSSTCRVYASVLRLSLGLRCIFLAYLPATPSLPAFCSSGHDFVIPSSRLRLKIQTLETTFEFVGVSDNRRRIEKVVEKGDILKKLHFAEASGHWSVFQRPLGAAQRPAITKLLSVQ